ncbi:MAG: mechanosensitive ion channel family protein [Bacteroidota bacterium]
MSNLTRFLEESLGLSPLHQTKILYSVIILAALWTLRYLILKLVWRFTEEPKTRYTWKRTISFVIGFLTVILIMSVWIKAIRQFGAFLGLFTAGLAIALKDPLTNMAGWLFILLRNPFAIGDRIQIGEHAGDVIDIRLFQFSLLEIGNWVHADQSTGRIIHVPNGKVFTSPQANYSAGFQFIWNEMKVLVTFDSNWQKAKTLLEQIITRNAEATSDMAEQKIREASKKYMIFYQYLTPIVYTTIEESGVQLTMRYICEPRKRRTSANGIWEDVLQEFAKHPDIRLAYPTRKVVMGEGKE